MQLSHSTDDFSKERIAALCSLPKNVFKVGEFHQCPIIEKPNSFLSNIDLECVSLTLGSDIFKDDERDQ